MLLEIDTHSGVPIYRQIVRQIRQYIITGQAPQGRQLPTVRQSGRQLKVNPMTVSKAYSIQETERQFSSRIFWTVCYPLP